MLKWDPPGLCYPEAHPKYLVSNQKWPKKGQKGSNIAKNGLKRVTLPLEDYFGFFPAHFFG